MNIYELLGAKLSQWWSPGAWMSLSRAECLGLVIPSRSCGREAGEAWVLSQLPGPSSQAPPTPHVRSL